MSDMLSQLYKLLVDVIVPNLKGIQASQAEQRMKTDLLNQNLDEFRSEMHIQFAEIRAELAAIRVQVEDAMVTLSESEAVPEAEAEPRNKKSLIH